MPTMQMYLCRHNDTVLGVSVLSAWSAVQEAIEHNGVPKIDRQLKELSILTCDFDDTELAGVWDVQVVRVWVTPSFEQTQGAA